jgi:hypothetical protein
MFTIPGRLKGRIQNLKHTCSAANSPGHGVTSASISHFPNAFLLFHKQTHFVCQSFFFLRAFFENYIIFFNSKFLKGGKLTVLFILLFSKQHCHANKALRT